MTINTPYRRIATRCSFLLIALSLVLVVGLGHAQEARQGGTAEIAVSSWPVSLDPHISPSGHDRHILYNVYNTLVAIDEDFDLQPELATSWSTPDETTVVLELQEGVTFHDGTPFDAEAVRFNFERMLEHPRSARLTEIEAVESVDVVDDLTVQINLARPEAGLLNALADRAGMMVSPAATEELGDEFERNPVGTGPFVYESAVVDDHVRLERNEDYWEDGLPYLDALVVRVVLEDPSKIIGLRTGDLDVIDTVPPRDIETVRGDPDLTYYEVPGTGTRMMAFNVQLSPFDDVRVRQALSYAIDREAMIEALQFGQAVPSRGPFAPTRGYTYHPDLDRYTYDPEQARELLAEAGYADGFEMDIDVFNRTADRAWAEAIQGFYADVGVEANVIPGEQVALNEKWREIDDFPAYVGSWGAGAINPDVDLVRAFHSEGWWNHANYGNPEVDALIDEILRTFDTEERGRLYREVQELVVEDAPRVFLFHENLRYATRADVQGFVPMADWAIRMKEVWLDR